MNEELVKNLTSLIDETLVEIEDLKKSRYSAAEVDMGKMESGVANQDANGDMGKKDDDDDDDDKDDKDMDKGEGKNSESDPGTRGVTPQSECGVPSKSSLHQEANKAEDDDDDDKDDKDKDDKDMDKGEGKNSESDPGTRGVTPPSESGVPSKSSLMAEAKKSVNEDDSLMKSYIDSKVGGLESKLDSIATLVKELADTPVQRKGTPATAVPLAKSESEGAGLLSKADVSNKLLEMKKSDTSSVDTNDIIAVETGMGLQPIIDKYNLK